MTVVLFPSISRAAAKAEMLVAQVRETLVGPSSGAAIDADALLKGHDVEKRTYGLCLVHHLEALMALLGRFQVTRSAELRSFTSSRQRMLVFVTVLPV